MCVGGRLIPLSSGVESEGRGHRIWIDPFAWTISQNSCLLWREMVQRAAHIKKTEKGR